MQANFLLKKTVINSVKIIITSYMTSKIVLACRDRKTKKGKFCEKFNQPVTSL
jgi:hypothetical protein